MPALTRGHLRALLAGRATPRDEEEVAIVMKRDAMMLLAWVEKYREWAEKSPVAGAVCSIVLMLSVIFVAWAVWYGILSTAAYVTGCNLRPASTAALVLAVQVLRPSPTSRL